GTTRRATPASAPAAGTESASPTSPSTSRGLTAEPPPKANGEPQNKPEPPYAAREGRRSLPVRARGWGAKPPGLGGPGGYPPGQTQWRWRESNPRPSVHHQGFSGRSLL